MRWWFGTGESLATWNCLRGLRALPPGIARGRRAALFTSSEASRNPPQKVCWAKLAVLSPRVGVDLRGSSRGGHGYRRGPLLVVFTASFASQGGSDRVVGKPRREPRSRAPARCARTQPQRAPYSAGCPARAAPATAVGRICACAA